MMRRGLSEADNKIAKNNFQGFVKLVESCIKFDRWGFKQSYFKISEVGPTAIYDSDKCRVKFVWDPPDPRDGYANMDITYGRLHASPHQRFIYWKGRKSHCWHDFFWFYSFLDGLSPQETVEKRGKFSTFGKQIYQMKREPDWSVVEWSLRLHSAIWEHYGTRLFDLFDLRQPEQWEQYTNYVEELYRIEPRLYNPNDPPPENIC